MYATGLVQLESALARSLAVRMGVDHETDPSPRMLVAAVLAALRAGTAWWEASGQVGSAHRVLERAFEQMAADAPPRW